MPVVDFRAERDARALATVLAADAHVRVSVGGWHLGGGRWWVQPCTTSRMGDLTPAAWDNRIRRGWR